MTQNNFVRISTSFRQAAYFNAVKRPGYQFLHSLKDRIMGHKHAIILGLMALGAMAGSTSGGVKSLRAILALRAVRNVFQAAGHRNAVQPPVRYGGRPVAAEVVTSVWAFLAIFFGLAALMSLAVAAAGYGLGTAASAGLTSLGNVGPGLGEIGPYDQFGHFPPMLKIGFAFCMLAGRLELFTLLVLLSPGFWRR